MRRAFRSGRRNPTFDLLEDRCTPTLGLASPDALGVQGNGQSWSSSISADDGSQFDAQSIESASIVIDGGDETFVNVAENLFAVTTVAVSGGNGASTFSIAGGADALRFGVTPSTGVLMFVAAPDYENPIDADGDNVYEVIVRVSDGVESATQTIHVTVTPINDNVPMFPGYRFFPDLIGPQYGSGFGASVAYDGDFYVVSEPYGDSNGLSDVGLVHVYSIATGSRIAKLTNPTPVLDDVFGSSVAVSGNIVVVGADGDDTGATESGSTYLFDATTGALVATLNNPTPAAYDRFGDSVAASGNLVVVGAPNDTVGGISAGSVYVFNATTGALIATIPNPSPGTGDRFGSSVALSGTTLVVAASSDQIAGSPVGSAYVFDVTTSALIATLASPMPNRANFASSVAVSGSVVAVGAYGHGTGGAAYAFDATTGALIATLANPTPANNDYFGLAVAVSGNAILVGAREDDSEATDSGSVYLFDSATGSLIDTLANPTPGFNSRFGVSLAASGNRIVVGSNGSAQVFHATTRQFIGHLENSAGPSNESFGYSTAISEQRVVVGAYKGLVGTIDAGTVSVFDRTTGERIALLENPTPAHEDWFGFSVATSGNVVVVGAYRDDSDGTDTGRAYLFDATTGELIATLAAPNPTAFGYFGTAVAIHGNIVAVGAPAGGGTVFLFDATTGAWIRTLNNPAQVAVDFFGLSVTVSESFVVVGSPFSNRAFVFNAATGSLISTLYNPTAGDDRFGNSVAVLGDKVVVGSYLDDAPAFNSGNAWVFDATTGNLIRQLKNPGPTSNDNFGSSVAISGSTVMVGAPGDLGAGSVYLYNLETGALIARLANPTPATQDFFGRSVSMLGSTMIVGADLDDTNNSDQGAVYRFELYQIPENTTAVVTLTAVDADSPPQPLIYSISGGADAGKFQIDPSTGALAFLSPPNFESPTDVGGNNAYEVTIQVSDGAFATTQAIVVQVSDVFDPIPVLTGVAPFIGPTTGGFALVITGTNFTGATAVTVGTQTIPISPNASATSIIVAAPPASATGLAIVTVTGPGGTSSPTTFTLGVNQIEYADAVLLVEPLGTSRVGEAVSFTLTLSRTIPSGAWFDIRDALAGDIVVGGIVIAPGASSGATTISTLSAGSHSLYADCLGSAELAPIASPPISHSVAATKLLSTIIDDGLQSSVVRSVTLTFNGVIDSIDPSAIAVTDEDGQPIDDLSPFVIGLGGNTLFVFFLDSSDDETGPVTFGSLVDGRYRIVVDGALLVSAGAAVDADGDGQAGGTSTTNFTRLFGDVNGDGFLDALDIFPTLIDAVDTLAGNPGYNVAFDYDNDGDVDALDIYPHIITRIDTGI